MRQEAMAMGAVDRFLANPVEFMQNNIVSTPEGGDVNKSGGLKFFTLDRLSSTGKSAERPGAAIPTYMARPGNGPEGFMEIYWCPYQDDSIQSTTVGNTANIMFTAPMNGCSFGVGTTANDGSRRVAHINMKSQLNAWNKQDAILKGSKLGDKIVSPHMYMGDDKDPVHVITFGVRNAKSATVEDRWNFYYQLTKMSAGATGLAKLLIGVYPV
jgi:hypothetical protein